MKKFTFRFIVIGLLFIIRATNAWTQDTLPQFLFINNDTLIQFNLTADQYQMLPDKSGKLTIDDVRNGSLTKQFFPRNVKQAGIDTLVNTIWFRYRVKNNVGKRLNVSLVSSTEKAEFFVFRNNNNKSHFRNGKNVSWNDKDGLPANDIIPLILEAGEEMMVYYRRESETRGIPPSFNLQVLNTEKYTLKRLKETQTYVPPFALIPAVFCGFCLLGALFNLFFFIIDKQKVYLYFSLFLLNLSLTTSPWYLNAIRYYPEFAEGYNVISGLLFVMSFIQFIRYYFQTFLYTPKWDKFLIVLIILQLTYIFSRYKMIPSAIGTIVSSGGMILSCLVTLFIFYRLKHKNVKPFAIALLPLILSFLFLFIFTLLENAGLQIPGLVISIGLAITALSIGWVVLYFTWILFKQYDRQKREIIQIALEAERMAKEKEIERSNLIEQQKVELEKTVQERTAELRQSIENLKATQTQLIQSEKMASLGELTAGIAHEIQNPLNFVNNFSDLNAELIEELKEELATGNTQEAISIAEDIKENEQKINHHGKRADAIVKGMLQHSRANGGKKEPTDINALADECLRLSYHGLRAKDKDFSADLKTDFDHSIGKIEVVPQDIGRVLLNLYNNAFYAVSFKKAQLDRTFEPTVSVSTKRADNKVEISVKDNGTGITQKVVDKIFQPFFTTKPTGQGTGLGLSLSYDIIKAHGGELRVETKENEGAEFIIKLPVIN